MLSGRISFFFFELPETKKNKKLKSYFGFGNLFVHGAVVLSASSVYILYYCPRLCADGMDRMEVIFPTIF